MDIQVPIIIKNELMDDDDIIEATGKLNLSSGEISNIEYKDYDVKAEGEPAERDDYFFTTGLLSIEGKELEFGIAFDDGEFSVSPDELLEIKSKAAGLITNASKKKQPR